VLVTVRYEKNATVRRKKLYIVGIRETAGESGDIGAWLYPVSERVHRNCGGCIQATVDYLCKETKIPFPCYNIFCDVYF
jgi:hypothetical protein